MTDALETVRGKEPMLQGRMDMEKDSLGSEWVRVDLSKDQNSSGKLNGVDEKSA